MGRTGSTVKQHGGTIFLSQPEDRYKIAIEPQRGLFGSIEGDNMALHLTSGHDSQEFDCNKGHRTLTIRLGDAEGKEKWVINTMRIFEGSMTIEFTLQPGPAAQKLQV